MTDKIRLFQEQSGEFETQVDSPLPQKHPALNAWSRYQATGSFAVNKSWLHHPEHMQGAMWGIFIEGYRAGMAQSTCYVADATSAPQKVTFNNGRVVTLHQQSDGYHFLEVENVPTDGTGNKANQ